MGAAAGAAQVGMGGLQMAQANTDAKAMKQQADFDAMQMRFNSSLVKYQQEDLQDQTTRDIIEREKQVKQMIGSQRATMAAQGIEVEGEIGAAVEEETRMIGMEDVQAIKNNAWRESMGLQIKERDLLTQARSTELSGQSKANSTRASGMLSGMSTGLSGISRMGIKPSYSNNNYTNKTGGKRSAWNYKAGSSRGIA